VIENDFATGPILHVSAHGGVKVEQLVSSVSRELAIDNLVVTPGELDSPSPLEQIVDRRMTFYGSYLRSQKVFDRSLPRSWSVHEPAFEQFVAEGVQELRGLTLRRAARRKQRTSGSA